MQSPVLQSAFLPPSPSKGCCKAGCPDRLSPEEHNVKGHPHSGNMFCLFAAIRAGSTAAAPNYLLINRAQLASAQLLLCIFVPSPLFQHGECSFSSMCLDGDAFATELAGRGKMFIARAGLSWRRAQSVLPATSLHTNFRRKSKHWGVFHHDSRALGFPRAAQSLGCRDSGVFFVSAG